MLGFYYFMGRGHRDLSPAAEAATYLETIPGKEDCIVRKLSGLLLLILFVTVLLTACGGGGGGGTPLSPPAFTNLAGTSWSQTDTVSSSNTCGIATGYADSFTVDVLAQSGNTLTVYDTRSGASNAISASFSGYNITSSGPRYVPSGFSCSNLIASYNLTLNNAGTSYSGTGTIECLDNNCTVPVNVIGNKL